MAPTVILIRHGQALHNETEDYSIPDPPLTRLGIKQCEALRVSLQNECPEAKDIELAVVSPMRRTLQTAQIGLEPFIKKGVPVVLRGEWQETTAKPCDTGTPVEIISQEFPNFDFSTVFPEWPSKEGRWSWTEDAVINRGKDCRIWLQKRPEKVIAVVSHSGFLRLGVSHCSYNNADYRVFDFATDGSDKLVERAWTRENGGGLGASKPGAFGFPSEGYGNYGGSSPPPPRAEEQNTAESEIRPQG